MPKRLLVASVFAGSERDPLWLNLQRRYLNRTTDSFDHAIFINTEEDSTELENSIKSLGSLVIGKYSKVDSGGEIAGGASYMHAFGLNKIIDYCRKHSYDHYLILDSDCFPVTRWQDLLLQQMGDRPIAAVIRTENLDVFPHPCAFFIRGEHIHQPFLDFTPAACKNLLQYDVKDTGCAIPLSECYPLLRSNVWNPHPILAAIYSHFFYHHGAGSRTVTIRSILWGYYNHVISKESRLEVEGRLFDEIEKSPDDLINRLLGNTSIPKKTPVRTFLRRGFRKLFHLSKKALKKMGIKRR